MATIMPQPLISISWLKKAFAMRTLLPLGLFAHPRAQVFFTGMHQTTVGTHHHRSFARRPDFVQMLPHYLLAAGYNCSAINTDLNTDIDP